MQAHHCVRLEDLKVGPSCGKPVNNKVITLRKDIAYVALSRSRSRKTIRLLRDFDNGLFLQHPSEDLRAEDLRIDAIVEETKKKYDNGQYGAPLPSCKLKQSFSNSILTFLSKPHEALALGAPRSSGSENESVEKTAGQSPHAVTPYSTPQRPQNLRKQPATRPMHEDEPDYGRWVNFFHEVCCIRHTRSCRRTHYPVTCRFL